ncbi:MAG TPA: hypothetical protein VMB35_09580 [Methanomicrobiales archaeon]|nr:hypothetical protein [Methanomicrobiales archaeon]
MKPFGHACFEGPPGPCPRDGQTGGPKSISAPPDHGRLRWAGTPDISDQERGRRFFQLQKEKHAEEALDRVRKNLGDGWKRFTLQEVKTLRSMIGEAWVFTDRKAWETFSFARLTREDLDAILRVGNAVDRREMSGADAAKQVSGILRRVS